MEVHDVIEEVDEDKNNNNTNMVKSGKFNDDNKNNINENKNVNIKIVKEDKNEEKEIKKGFRKGNKFNQMYKSLALSKEKKLNKINIIENENYNYASNGIDFKNKSNNIESSTGDKQYPKNDNISKINLPLLYKPSNISSKNKFPNNINNETPSTSAYTNSTKNNLRNDDNLTEQIGKFRIGLFSANSSSNNNAIIPIFPIKRPVSNFNFGGNQLWEKDDKNKNKEKNNNNEILIEKEINTNKEQKFKNISLNKFLENNKTRDIFKSTDSKYKFVSSSNKNEGMNNNNNNLKTKMIIFGKEKGQDNIFNKKLIEFKKIPSHFNKSNNFFLVRNGNKSHSMRKFM